MRMRYKPYARPQLAACAFNVQTPQQLKNSWAANFKHTKPIALDLGCGKGYFLAKLAAADIETNYIGIDIKSEVLIVAKRNIEQAFAAAQRSVDNVLITSHDIERLPLIFGELDEIAAIYINFPNPWGKVSDHKHRLTHTRQLLQYKTFLAPGAHINFKTDDAELYADTLKYFAQAGYAVINATDDVYATADYRLNNFLSEHEMKFIEAGKKIKNIIATPR